MLPIKTCFAAILLTALLALATLACVGGGQQSELSGLDSYIAKGMREWQVPGLTIAVVKDDAVVLAKGYGVREVGKPERVDEHSLFGIGSCSRTFGGASMVMLAHDEKLKLDDSALEYLPWLQRLEPQLWLRPEVRVRDLVSYRVGSAWYEHWLWAISADPRDMIRRLRYVQPAAPVRDVYAYSSAMSIIASEVIKDVSGAASWNDFVRDRIWRPLGMNRTTADFFVVRATANKAMPHNWIDGKLQAIDWEYKWHLGNAAGGVNTTAWDMAQWLRFQLGDGRFDGRELIRADLFREMHTPRSPVGTAAKPDSLPIVASDFELASYGTYWFVDEMAAYGF